MKITREGKKTVYKVEKATKKPVKKVKKQDDAPVIDKDNSKEVDNG